MTKNASDITLMKEAMIEKIMRIEDLSLIEKVNQMIDIFAPKEDKLSQMIKPMKETLDIEEMKREQGYKPIDSEVFFRQLDALGIEEPLEDLLKML
jgi:hypothetical protein